MRLKTFFLYSFLLIIILAACQPAATAPGSSLPMLTVREGTNCRTGPGEPYEIIYTVPSGTQLEIVGRYVSGNFWVVKSGQSPTGTCWMWGGSVDVTGNYAAVPNVTPPEAPTSGPLQTLIVDNWEYSCEGNTVIFTLRWQDRATDETGYRIFRNGESLAELPAGSTAYADTFVLPEDRSVEYYLQAFGPDWATNSAVMTADC